MLYLQTEEVQAVPTTTRNKNFIASIVLAAFLATFFYLFEFVPEYSGNFKEVNTAFLEAKANNKKALGAFKESYAHTQEYKKYQIANLAYKKAVTAHKKAIKNEAVFGFVSFQLFSYEFFPLLGVLSYCLFNLVSSIKNKTSNMGNRLVHFVVLMFVFFKLNWILKITTDYPKIFYYLFAIASAYLISTGIFILLKKKYDLIDKLQKSVNVFSRFSFVKAKKYIDKDKQDRYTDELLFDLRKEID